MFRLFVVKARLVFVVRLTITQWKIFRKFPERLSVLPVENGTIIPRPVSDRIVEAKSKVDGLKRIKVDFSSEKTAQLKSKIRSNFRPSVCEFFFWIFEVENHESVNVSRTIANNQNYLVRKHLLSVVHTNANMMTIPRLLKRKIWKRLQKIFCQAFVF